MKFYDECSLDGCKGNEKGCFVVLPLYRGKVLINNLIGKMCCYCGAVYIIDPRGNVLVENIPVETEFVLPIHRSEALFSNTVVFCLTSGKISVFNKWGDKSILFPDDIVALTCYKKGVQSGKVLKFPVFPGRGTIGNVKPHFM